MAMTDGITPVMNVGGNNGGLFGGGTDGGAWILFLFFILAMGGNGFGGNGNQRGEISNDFLYTNLNNDLNTDFIQVYQQNQALAKDMCNGFSNVNSNLCNGFANTNSNMARGFADTNLNMVNATNGINGNINTLSREMAECCCTTNRNIDSIKLDNERNTNAIIQNASANTQSILDKMCQNEIQALRDELNETRRQADICAQNDMLISHLRPFPVPAYASCSPYASTANVMTNSGCCGL